MIRTIKKIIHMLDFNQKKQATFLIFLMIIGMFFEMVSIGAIIPAFSLIANPNFLNEYPLFENYVSFFGEGEVSLVTAAIFTLLNIYMIKSIFLSFLAWYQTKFVFDFQAKISARLFRQYLFKDYTFHIANNSSTLIRNVANETTQLSNGAILTGLNVLLETLVIIGLASFLIYVEPFGAIITIISLSASGFIFFYASRRYVLKWGIDRQYADGKRIKGIQQGLGGIKEIKLLGREDSFHNKYIESNNLFANAARKQSFLLNIPRLVIEFVAILALSILVLILMHGGSSLISLLPILGLFAAAAFRLMPSVNRILGNYQTLQYSAPVVDLITKELKDNILISDLYIPSKNTIKDDIQFNKDDDLSLKDIFFSYGSDNLHALDNININIKSGNMIGLIGPSGSGKSTLVDIILGLLEPSKGSINFGEKNIHTNINYWQNNIGYVPQNIYLVDDTLRRNIALGLDDEEIDENRIFNAIKLSNLEEFIKESEDGLDMMVGERGVKLSGGQLQRIGIARSLYHDPSILILDEATSALDSNTESQIMNSIIGMKGKKTIIIIAHRLSTVRKCDYIFELSNGKVINEGKPEEVLKNEL